MNNISKIDKKIPTSSIVGTGRVKRRKAMAWFPVLEGPEESDVILPLLEWITSHKIIVITWTEILGDK